VYTGAFVYASMGQYARSLPTLLWQRTSKTTRMTMDAHPVTQ
jgi:hypothetical protein